MSIKVIKRDGSKEDFMVDKISRVVEAAGLKNDEVQNVTKNTLDWLQQINAEEISSLQIRDKVIEELKKINGYAADMFVWYEQTKDSPKS